MSECPTYPATTVSQAAELLVDDANRMHLLVHGGVDTVVETCEGNGDIPSWQRALNQRATYKTPLDWANGTTETDLTQPRTFDSQIYIPLRTPTTMGVSPGNDWSLYSYTNIFSTEVESFADALAGDFTNVNRVVIQSYSTTQNRGKGGFVGIKNGNTGSSGTGTCLLWRDNVGNEFILPPDINPDPYMFGINDDGTDQTTEFETALTAIDNSGVHNTMMIPIPATGWGVDALDPPTGINIIGTDPVDSRFVNLGTGAGIDTDNDDVGLFNFTMDATGRTLGILLGTTSNDCRLDALRVTGATVYDYRLRGSGHKIGTIESLNAPANGQGVYFEADDLTADTVILTDSRIRVENDSVNIGQIVNKGQPSVGPIFEFFGSEHLTIGSVSSNGLQPTNVPHYLMSVDGADYLDIGVVDITVDDWDNTSSIVDGPAGPGSSIGKFNLEVVGGTSNFESTPIIDNTGGSGETLAIRSMYVHDGSATSASEGTRFVDFEDGATPQLSHFSGNKFVENNAVRIGTDILLPNTMTYEVAIDSEIDDPASTFPDPLFIGQELNRVSPDGNIREIYQGEEIASGGWVRTMPDVQNRIKGQSLSDFELKINTTTGTATGGADGKTFNSLHALEDWSMLGDYVAIILETDLTITEDVNFFGTYVRIDGDNNTITFDNNQNILLQSGATLFLNQADIEYQGTSSPFEVSGADVLLNNVEFDLTAASSSAPVRASRGARVRFSNATFTNFGSGTRRTVDPGTASFNRDYTVTYDGTTTVGSEWTLSTQQSSWKYSGTIGVSNGGAVNASNTANDFATGTTTKQGTATYRVAHGLGVVGVNASRYSITATVEGGTSAATTRMVKIDTVSDDNFELTLVNSSFAATEATSNLIIHWHFTIFTDD